MKTKKDLLNEAISYIKLAINRLDLLDQGCKTTDYRDYAYSLKEILSSDNNECGLEALLKIVSK